MPQGDRILRGGDPARSALCACLCEALGRGKESGDWLGVVAPEEIEGLIAKARSSPQRASNWIRIWRLAHSAQGAILQNIDFDFTAAEAEYRRAFELAPQNPAVIASLAILLARLGRLDEAVALQQRAVALDPLRVQSHFNLAHYFVALGRNDEAEAGLRKAIDASPAVRPKLPVAGDD